MCWENNATGFWKQRTPFLEAEHRPVWGNLGSRFEWGCSLVLANLAHNGWDVQIEVRNVKKDFRIIAKMPEFNTRQVRGTWYSERYTNQSQLEVNFDYFVPAKIERKLLKEAIQDYEIENLAQLCTMSTEDILKIVTERIKEETPLVQEQEECSAQILNFAEIRKALIA